MLPGVYGTLHECFGMLPRAYGMILYYYCMLPERFGMLFNNKDSQKMSFEDTIQVSENRKFVRETLF